MDGHEGWEQPKGFFPNGLLPNEAANVTRMLDLGRWSQAEEKTAELIECIQPNQPSEERRNAIVCYMQQLILKCLSCQVFTFGSVPLKTYLQDGDIDLTAFANNKSVKDTWAKKVRDILESEKKREDAEFCIKEVHYIQAEVKIIKCLVENIVVDISFDQLGGLCTLCFLEEVDQLINQNHLFKRSIILIKAWCYYESRILGAHHGLISTYALEILVIYIFHVFNNSFVGPLEVLYRFLEFFSKFDWDNFGVSLWGPVPISSLSDMNRMTANPPRKDGGNLLLSKSFLDSCGSSYSIFPGGQENQERPFISKHFNVIDPLRTNNNLGRSVSKGNFFRIRSAFAFGAQRLARLLDCPKENLIAEVNQFFMNTWDRHGRGHHPGASGPDLHGLHPLDLNHIHESDRLSIYSNSKKGKENYKSHVSEGEAICAPYTASSQNGISSLKQSSRTNNVSTFSRSQNQKTCANLASSIASEQNHQSAHSINYKDNTHTNKERSSRPDYLGNEVHARYQLARTQSSPELTDGLGEGPYGGRHNRISETGKGQPTSLRLDSSRTRHLASEVADFHTVRSSNGDPLPLRQISSHRSSEVTLGSNSASSSYHGESGFGVMDELPSIGDTIPMHQIEKDIVSMIASSRIQNFSGQVQGASAVPISPSIYASPGYAHSNSAGMVHTNLPRIYTSSDSSMHYTQGLVSLPVGQYLHNVVKASNGEEMVVPANDNWGTRGMIQEVSDHGLRIEGDTDSMRGFDSYNGSLIARQLAENQQFPSEGFDFVPSIGVSSSLGYSMKGQGFVKGNQESIRETNADNYLYHNIRGSDICSTASSRFVSASQSTSSTTKLSSDGSRDGLPLNVFKSSRDRRGRKTVPSTDRFAYGLHKHGLQYEGKSVDHHSSQANDNSRNWNWISLPSGNEVSENTVHNWAPFSHVQAHHIPDYEPAQMTGSNPMLPVAAMLAGSGSLQRGVDNYGVLPLAVYPTGSLVSFLTIPVYNFPNEGGISGVSTCHSDLEGEMHSHVSKSVHSLDLAEDVDQLKISNISDSMKGTALMEPPEHCKSDIFNSDFASHWQNLQYGRFCQNLRDHDPSYAVAPPVYLQGHLPDDGRGRPLHRNVNPVTQLMGCVPHHIPISLLQPASNTPGVYQHCGNKSPKCHGGTADNLPNPICFRDQESSYTKHHRRNYSFDHKDHHAERKGIWVIKSKPKFAGRGQGRNLVEKPNTRIDRTIANNSQSYRESSKRDSCSSYSRNASFSSSKFSQGSANVAYGMYQHPVFNHNGVSSSGTGASSVVMFSPYDQKMGYDSPAKQLKFGTVGPVDFSGINKVSQLSEGSLMGVNKQQYHGDPMDSLPDLRSLPKLQRKTEQVEKVDICGFPEWMSADNFSWCKVDGDGEGDKVRRLFSIFPLV